MTEMENGKTYKLNHLRKGEFVLSVISQDSTWVSGVIGVIVSGKANAMLSYNVKETGEEITVRKEFLLSVEEVSIMLIPPTHIRKIWPEFVGPIMSKQKTFEIRREDTAIFRVGDALELLEWCPKIQKYSGLIMRIKIEYVSRDFLGIEKGFAVLGLSHYDEYREISQHVVTPTGPTSGYLQRYGISACDTCADEIYFLKERKYLE